MIVFWSIVAAMVLAALVFVLPPLLGWGRKAGVARDEVNVAIYQQRLAELQADLKNGMLSPQQFGQAQQELEKQLLQDVSDTPEDMATTSGPSRWGAIIAGIVLPALALGLYLQLGGYDTPALKVPSTTADPQQATPGMASVEEMVSRLAERLRSNPNDLEGWRMLGRSYAVLQRFPEAAQAYAKAYELGADDPQSIADYAEVLALANNGDLAGEPTELVAKVLERQPDNPKALWLAGIAAIQKGNTAQAVARWERLLAMLPKGGTEAHMVERAIAEAKGETAPQRVAQAGAEGQVPASRGSIKVRVTMAPELAARASPEDTVFVFARAGQGPRVPLATVRKQVKDLPVTITLDDSMARTATPKLSGFPDVVLEARVSKSGNAVPEPGDLEAERVTAKAGSEEPVELTVDQVVGEKAQGQGPPTNAGGVSMTADATAEGTVGPAASEAAEGTAPPGGQNITGQITGQTAGGEAAVGGAQSAAEQGNLSDTSRSASAETAGRALQVRVTVAPNLADKISPEDTLFVYARAAQGPRMPLAIVRKQAKDLPATVTLDDSSSMMPGMPLSNLPVVVLGARISKSGNAMPQSGDLQGFSPPVRANGSQPAEVTIDKVIP